MADKYANQRYAMLPLEDMPQVCQHHNLSQWSTLINGPGDLDLELSPFDLETGLRVASEVGNLHYEFGNARPSGSRVIPYVRDGRTYRQTDRQKQCLPAAFLRAGA